MKKTTAAALKDESKGIYSAKCLSCKFFSGAKCAKIIIK